MIRVRNAVYVAHVSALGVFRHPLDIKGGADVCVVVKEVQMSPNVKKSNDSERRPQMNVVLVYQLLDAIAAKCSKQSPARHERK